jgi:hypothetical protein
MALVVDALDPRGVFVLDAEQVAGRLPDALDGEGLDVAEQIVVTRRDGHASDRLCGNRPTASAAA